MSLGRGWENRRFVQVLDDIGLKSRPPRRFDVLFNIALCSVVLGVVLGALMSWFNAWLDPGYFQQTMGWSLEEVQPASLIQGGLGGLAYGFAFAGFFVIICGWATQFNCTFSFAFRQLLKISLFVILGWAAGGLAISTFPQQGDTAFSSMASTLSGLPGGSGHSPWPSGSIPGQKAGFLLGAVLCPFIVWRAWRRRNEGMKE